jgi:DNA repair photolyase
MTHGNMEKKRRREEKIPELYQARETFGKTLTRWKEKKRYICISYVSSMYDIVEERKERNIHHK